MTLAPEEVPAGFIAELARAGVSRRSGIRWRPMRETRAAMAEGLTGFTHLFNAMRPLDSREPGPIAAALETADAWYGLIVDGEHVDPAMLRLALRGLGRPLLVTDAMPPVGGSSARSRSTAKTSRARRPLRAADGTLAGSALDMASAVRNAVRLLESRSTAPCTWRQPRRRFHRLGRPAWAACAGPPRRHGAHWRPRGQGAADVAGG